jgi:uncharacterized protein (TIGR02996 family)
MRSEKAALLRAIVGSPNEDTPRLVYADWLDENGDSDRAEFIRGTGPGSTCHDNDGRLVRYFAGTTIKELGDLARFVAFYDIRYGFVDHVSVPIKWAATKKLHRPHFLAHPIRSVRVTDRSPYAIGNSGLCYWACVSLGSDVAARDATRRVFRPCDIPKALFQFIADHDGDYTLRNMRYKMFSNPTAAISALHNACVAFGRFSLLRTTGQS